MEWNIFALIINNAAAGIVTSLFLKVSEGLFNGITLSQLQTFSFAN